MSSKEIQTGFAGEIVWIEETVSPRPAVIVPPPVPEPVRFYSAISSDTILTQAEIDSGFAGASPHVVVPSWSGNSRRYLFFGVSEHERITGISVGGIPVTMAYQESVIAAGIRWWRSRNTQSNVAGGTTYSITIA